MSFLLTELGVAIELAVGGRFNLTHWEKICVTKKTLRDINNSNLVFMILNFWMKKYGLC